MTDNQLHALSLRDTDVQGAVNRLCGDEKIYIECLRQFVDDPTIAELNSAIDSMAWDEAFTAAHALKGLAGNMGFIPLMHSTGQLVVLIRGGRTRDLADSIAQVNSCYRDITDAIKRYFFMTDEENSDEG